MKKNILSLIFVFLLFNVFAEKVTFHTGEAFGISNADYFFPIDIIFTGCRCTVTSIMKIENDLWCFTLTIPNSNTTNAPVVFNYYIKKNDIVKMRRLNNPGKVVSLNVASVNWNEVTFDIEQ